MLSLLPGAGTLNYWGQRFVTRAYSDFEPIVKDKIEKPRWFTQQFARYSSVSATQSFNWFTRHRAVNRTWEP